MLLFFSDSFSLCALLFGGGQGGRGGKGGGGDEGGMRGGMNGMFGLWFVVCGSGFGFRVFGMFALYPQMRCEFLLTWSIGSGRTEILSMSGVMGRG